MMSGEELLRCNYMLPTKKRRCRMLVKKGNLFCGEHSIHDPSKSERVICPNDPKHTVKKDELEKHLATKCNSRLPDEPWIVFNINVANQDRGTDRVDECDNRRPDDEQLSRMSALIQNAIQKVSSCITDRVLTSKQITDHLSSNTHLSGEHRKHLIQLSSIIGHLIESDLLKNDSTNCMIDLGAGKALLSYWMARSAPKSHYLLIDRSGCRNKHDNKAIQENSSLKMDRLRCSIEHLDLSKVDILKNMKSVVAVWKHFCGEATDCGIRCLSNALSKGLNIDGFALAPCCHHKSSFAQYTGKQFLKKHGISDESDFNLLRYFATWAVCGMTKIEHEMETSDGSDNVSVEIQGVCQSVDSETKTSGYEGNKIGSVSSLWTREDKQNLGCMAKVLLELGRAEYLQSLGYKISVYRYVDFCLSPENLLIVGTKYDNADLSI